MYISSDDVALMRKMRLQGYTLKQISKLTSHSMSSIIKWTATHGWPLPRFYIKELAELGAYSIAPEPNTNKNLLKINDQSYWTSTKKTRPNGTMYNEVVFHPEYRNDERYFSMRA